MLRHAILCFLFVVSSMAQAQGNFRFSSDKSRTVIPFKLINNLIIVPAKLNGVDLNFLLDTGVEETILFSLKDNNEITFENAETIQLRGLGSQAPIEGLKSRNNRLEFKDLHDDNHDIYIVLDQGFNFSSHIGVPVNGIIGYQFFRNNLVQIDYDARKITVFNDREKARAKIRRKFESFPLSIEFRKPYVTASIVQNERPVGTKLLLDTGSSDAVWLFEERSDSIALPEVFFEDFLGRGFSGDVHGKRGRIDKFVFGRFAFASPIAAF
ncbi:MAG: signal protein PDZ, partial [Proteobacteria bacterium]